MTLIKLISNFYNQSRLLLEKVMTVIQSVKKSEVGGKIVIEGEQGGYDRIQTNMLRRRRFRRRRL